MHTLPVKTGTRPLAQVQKLIPGLLLSAALAGAAILLGRSQWLQHNGISALTLAIVLGIVVGNTLYPRIAAGSAAARLATSRPPRYSASRVPSATSARCCHCPCARAWLAAAR